MSTELPGKRDLSREKAILVKLVLPGDKAGHEPPLEELRRLTETAGAQVLDRVVQKRSNPHPATFVGKGKAGEVGETAAALGADVIIFDHDLSPAQVRNLEKITERKIIDRSELILDIFATRAQTKQARVQVELAQLEYLRPRLRRMWTHLSRIEGGIGVRGPGETQIETDRRLVRRRFVGTWFDSRGVVLPLRATADQTTLTTNWGTPDTEQGRTVYRPSAKSELVVSDSVLTDGEWHQFGRAKYWRRVLTDADLPVADEKHDTALAQFYALPQSLVTAELRQDVLEFWTSELLDTGSRCGEIYAQLHGTDTEVPLQLTAAQLEQIRNHELPSFENPIVVMAYGPNGDHVAVFDSDKPGTAVRAGVSVWDENCAMWHPVPSRKVVDGLFVGRLEIDSQCRYHGSRYVAVYLHDGKDEGLPYFVKRCTFVQSYH